MRKFLLLIIPLGLAAPSDRAQINASPDDQTAIRELEHSFVVAWNNHDPKALSMLWDEDGDFVSPTGLVRRGRAELEAVYAAAHATRWKDAQLTSKIRAIRLPTPDVAVVDGSFDVTGVRSRTGAPLPSLEGLFTWVVVKKSGKWWIFADRVLRIRVKWQP